jgi:hypothetical protein
LAGEDGSRLASAKGRTARCTRRETAQDAGSANRARCPSLLTRGNLLPIRPSTPFDALIKGPRSLEPALADLRAQYALYLHAEPPEKHRHKRFHKIFPKK